MPRAFLLTTRRSYDTGTFHYADKKSSLSSSSWHDSFVRSDSSENSTECPDELYNLTKLAEVAVASEQLSDKKNFTPPSSDDSSSSFTYTHKLFDKSSRIPRLHLIKPENNGQSRSHNMAAPGDLIINLDGEHECNDCGKRYSTSSNLARHKQTHRSPGDKKAKRCPHCDKLYVSMPAYSMHVRTHNQGCKCRFCGKCFSRPWLLQGHIRTHTGEKPFKCSVCNKAFADKSNLRAHVQTHSNTKPHVCGRCGKAFALKSYLYKHEESSCMRILGRQGSSREHTPEKCNAAPTSVIVSAQKTVPKPAVFRSTVISPNPERLLYSTVQRAASSSLVGAIEKIRYESVQDQPVDFSSSTKKDVDNVSFYSDSERPGGYGIGMPIAV